MIEDIIEKFDKGQKLSDSEIRFLVEIIKKVRKLTDVFKLEDMFNKDK